MSVRKPEEDLSQGSAHKETGRRVRKGVQGRSVAPRAPGDPLARAIQDCYSASNRRGPGASRLAVDRVMQAFYTDPRIKRIVATLTYEHKMQEHRDEIVQRTAILFYERFLQLMIDRKNPDDDPYKYLYAICYNVLRTVRSQLRVDDVSLDATDGASNESAALLQEIAVSGHYEAVVEQIDREVAMREWTERAQNTVQADGYLRPVVAKKFSPPPSTARRQSRDSAPVKEKAKVGERLKSIRDNMHLRTIDLATMLGITAPVLSSYMYNRVDHIPLKVQKQADAIYADFTSRLDPRSQYLNREAMPDIVQDWISRLSESQSDPALAADERSLVRQIAALLQVNYTTVWRWRQMPTPMRPTLRKLRLYDDRILSAAAVSAASKGA